MAEETTHLAGISLTGENVEVNAYMVGDELHIEIATDVGGSPSPDVVAVFLNGETLYRTEADLLRGRTP